MTGGAKTRALWRRTLCCETEPPLATALASNRIRVRRRRKERDLPEMRNSSSLVRVRSGKKMRVICVKNCGTTQLHSQLVSTCFQSNWTPLTGLVLEDRHQLREGVGPANEKKIELPSETRSSETRSTGPVLNGGAGGFNSQSLTLERGAEK